MKKLLANNKGFTLIEALAAVTIIAVISLGTLISFASITNLLSYSNANNTAITALASAMDGGSLDQTLMSKSTQNVDFTFNVGSKNLLIHTNMVNIYNNITPGFSLTSYDYASTGGSYGPTAAEILAEMKSTAERLYDLMVEADAVWDIVKNNATQRRVLFNSTNSTPNATKFRYYVLQQLGDTWPELPLNTNGEYPNIHYNTTPLYIQVYIYNSSNSNIVVYVSDSTTSTLSSIIYNHDNGNWYIVKNPFTTVSVNQKWTTIRNQITGTSWQIYTPE